MKTSVPIRRTSSAVIVSLALADGGRTLLEVVSADFEKLVSRIAVNTTGRVSCT